MKKFSLTLLILIASFSIKAQSYVTIPDSSFVYWLNVNIPSAMAGNQMDTTDVSVTTLTSMDVSSNCIRDLNGIQYFTSLQTLNCTNNKIDTILNLPDSLQSLICAANWLTYIMEIPDSVTYFDCTQNQLDSLPTLPINLLHFDCHNNALTSLPTLPNSILYFDCSGNQLTFLPSLPILLPKLNCAENQLAILPALPNTITAIYCENNLLDSLPVLPINLDTLSCGSNQLTSLPTLPSSLTDLECYFNQLTSLPTLPSSLITLVCGGNLLTTLPSLPSSLITLTCYSNQLTFLPPLPSSLSHLDCNSNLITSLPALPGSLTYLDCRLNQITSLPTLTSLIQYLDCSNNYLSLLPTLPSSLVHLICSYNSLIDLPALPSSLYFLDCSNATLDSLPVLPGSLNQMDCSYNSLISLPVSINSVTELFCHNNLLTALPLLSPSIYTLICGNNNINCFEEFPSTLFWLDIYNNPFTCLPNYIPAMDPSILLYPLCISGDLINNPYSCTGAEGVVGYTYTDMNTNCVKDTLDGNLINIPVQLFDSAGIFLGQTYTATNGVYHFPESIGTYEVRVDTTGMPISPQCSSPGVDSVVTLTTSDPLISNVNFDFNCKPGFDVGVRSIAHCGLVFPGQTHNLRIDAGDMTQWYNMACAAGISGQIQMTITGPVTFSGSSVGALTPTISGTTYTYSIADFASIINTQAFGLYLTVDPTAGSGNQICIDIAVTPAGGDSDTTNNSFYYCYEVVNSHDPNMKETYPEDVPLNYSGWLTYTIQFQNTGTAPAININLRDTLDSQLDLSTFEVIGYSHQNHVVLNGNALAIQFPNIYLSDSTSSVDSSKGFFQYRIKPLPGLSCGSEIHNTASIYFDFNDPIVTNTTTNAAPQSPEPAILSDTTICHSSSITFNVSSLGNTINWYDASNTLINVGNTYTMNNMNTSTILYTQIIAPSGCGSIIEDINISVLPLLSSPILSLNDTLCFTNTLSFSASTVTGWNYNWSGPSGFISSLEDPILDSLSSQNNSGTYNLYISNGQCVSDTAQVYVQIDSLPLIIVTNNPYICLGDSIDLHATGNLNNIVWETGETSQYIFVKPTQTTLYNVSGSNTCGAATQNIIVTVNIPPTAIASDALLILGESTQLNASGGTIYSWYPNNGLSCTNCSNPTIEITQDQFYSVIVTDVNGCSDTADVFVKVVEETNTVYIPNSFSPNNDGLNDEFKITGKNINNVQTIIYGRLGDVIFESNDMNTGWDGIYKEKSMGPLVFIYLIRVTFNDGEVKKYKGTITLVK